MAMPVYETDVYERLFVKDAYILQATPKGLWTGLLTLEAPDWMLHDDAVQRLQVRGTVHTR